MRLARDGETCDLWIEQLPKRAQILWVRDAAGTRRHGEYDSSYATNRVVFELLLERLAAGWRRVRDPEREVEDDEPREPALEAALRTNLDDEAAALVYADWYQQRGHPRGALIAIQHRLASHPDDVALQSAERDLLLEEDERLLGPIERVRESYHLGLDLAWRHGFVHAARLDGKAGDHEPEDLLWELLRHPSARFLRELVIGCHAFGDQDNRLMTALLLAAEPAPPLRKLVLADFDDTSHDDIDISRAWLGDLAGLGDRYPLLEDLVIKGRLIGARDNARAHGGLAGFSLPRAKRLAIRTSGLMRETLAALLTAPWPALVELELWTGTDDYGCTCSAADFAPLFEDHGFPALRTLRLMNCEFTDELLPPVIAYVRRHPLDVLDVSLGTLTDAGANALVAGAGVLSTLRELRVYENCLSETGLACLREAGLPIVETPPFPGQGWLHSYNRTGSQKNARYATVTE